MVDFMDLTKLSRGSDKVLTAVTMNNREWLRLGAIRLQRVRDSGEWELSSYLLNATDFEHDSAFILRMHLIGVEYGVLEYGALRFTGWVKPDDDTFRVPTVDYDPLISSKPCDHDQCLKDPHLLVREKCYLPPPNPDLLHQVIGTRLDVWTGLKPNDEDGPQ